MSSQLERDLSRTLDEHATEATGAIELQDVRHHAHQLRRATQRRWATGLAAAAVLVVAVPAALLLPGDETTGPVDPSPTPTAVPDKLPEPTRTSAPDESVLAELPAGAGPNWPYLHEGQVQFSNGATAALPGGAAAVKTFVNYRGGWLVADDATATTTWYDNTGAAVRSGRGLSIVTSSDALRVGYLMADRAHLGDTTGMAEGEQTWPTPGVLDGLVGFVRDGLVVTAGGGDVRLLAWDGTTKAVAHLQAATASSDAADLVGGLVDHDQGAVVDLSTGRALWTEGWRPLAFSPDGHLLAAVPLADNGDPSELAILDARTGATVARTALVTNRIYLRGTPVWEDETHLLFVADSGPTPAEAILRMGTDSGLERATPPVAGGLTTDSAPYVLAAGR
ncbi:MAG TPA: hypothetical protein VFO98_05835 [Marmoricola sp.]|nr:hypothetical protein [Marmoricola sp.]